MSYDIEAFRAASRVPLAMSKKFAADHEKLRHKLTVGHSRHDRKPDGRTLGRFLPIYPSHPGKEISSVELMCYYVHILMIPKGTAVNSAKEDRDS